MLVIANQDAPFELIVPEKEFLQLDIHSFDQCRKYTTTLKCLQRKIGIGSKSPLKPALKEKREIEVMECVSAIGYNFLRIKRDRVLMFVCNNSIDADFVGYLIIVFSTAKHISTSIWLLDGVKIKSKITSQVP